MEATNEQLLAVLAQRIGEYEVNHQWLNLQLNAVKAQLHAAEVEKVAYATHVTAMQQEREMLVARLAELELPPKASPTKIRRRTLA